MIYFVFRDQSILCIGKNVFLDFYDTCTLPYIVTIGTLEWGRPTRIFGHS